MNSVILLFLYFSFLFVFFFSFACIFGLIKYFCSSFLIFSTYSVDCKVATLSARRGQGQVLTCDCPGGFGHKGRDELYDGELQAPENCP